jgi:hypothetical protein
MADQDQAAQIGDIDPTGKTKPGELHITVGPKPEIVPKKETTGAPTGEPTGKEGAPASTVALSTDSVGLITEAERRGLLSPDQRAMVNELRRRGALPPAAGAVAARPAQPQPQDRAPDIDYSSGASWDAKVTVKEADTPAEAKAGLQRLYGYGPGDVGQDAGGRWWVRDPQTGRRTAVFSSGFGGAFGEGLAGLQATAPEFMGSVAGGALGVEGGPVGVALGAGAGGAAGKGLAEATKTMRGFEEKTPGEALQALANAGMWNTLFAGGGTLSSALGRTVADALRSKFFEVTPESRAMTEGLLRGGARPSMKVAAPGGKSLQAKQNLRNLVKGDPQRMRNVSFAHQRMIDTLKYAGVPNSEIPEIYQEIIDPRRAVDVAPESRQIVGAVQAYQEGLQNHINDGLRTAQSIIDRMEQDLGEAAEGAEGVHPRFVEAAVASRRAFAAEMSRLYDDIDAMVGGKPIVPTAPMKKAAEQVVANLPKTITPSIFHEIVDLPPRITIKQAQRFRTRLFEQSQSGNLTPGTIEHDYNEVATATDAAMTPEAVDDRFDSARPALEKLQQVDKLYRNGIQKFKDLKLNQMIRDYRLGRVLDPEKFAASLFDTQSSFRVGSFRQIVGPDVWRAVQAADLRNMLRQATRFAGDSEIPTRVDGRALMLSIMRRGQMLDAIYTPEQAKLIKQYAVRLAALDGKIDVRTLTPDTFSQALARAVEAQQALEDLVRVNLVGALRNGTSEQIDAAINMLTRPGQQAQLEEAIRWFGDDSGEVAALRSAALRRALHAAQTKDVVGAPRIGGEKIDQYLSQYTKREQELLFPHGLAMDLRVVADQMRGLFPPEYDDMGTSLAAASIKLHVGPVILNPRTFLADLKWLEVSFVGWLTDRLTLIRMINDIPGPPVYQRMARQRYLRALWTNFLNASKQMRKYGRHAAVRAVVNEAIQSGASTAQQPPVQQPGQPLQ